MNKESISDIPISFKIAEHSGKFSFNGKYWKPHKNSGIAELFGHSSGHNQQTIVVPAFKPEKPALKIGGSQYSLLEFSQALDVSLSDFQRKSFSSQQHESQILIESLSDNHFRYFLDHGIQKPKPLLQSLGIFYTTLNNGTHQGKNAFVFPLQNGSFKYFVLASDFQVIDKRTNFKGKDTVWPNPQKDTGENLFIFEGFADCLKARELHYNAFTFSGGVQSFTKLASLFKVQNRTVHITLDQDKPSETALPKVALAFLEAGHQVKTVRLTFLETQEGKDFCDWLKFYSPNDFEALLNDSSLISFDSYKIHPEQNTNKKTDDNTHIEHCTDLGNAIRLFKAFGDKIRYCYQWDSWFIWNEKHWLKDKTGEIFRLAKKTVYGIYQEATKVRDEELRKELARHAIRSESKMRMEAFVSLTRSEEGIPIIPDQIDTDPWKLNVLNGTINLKTGKLLPHQKEDLITKIIPVEYHSNASCPIWLAFLNKIMKGNQNLISFLKQAVGYSLTGDVSEQVLFFLYGTGANGKSKFLEAILGITGAYGIQAVPDLLMLKHYESHPTGLADLLGRRFVSTIETEEGKRMAESLVKQMTGGDRLKARFMRQDFFEFQPNFKLWLAANHKPIIKGTDYAIWRRIRLIPFEVTLSKSEQDKKMGEKLKSEYPGILRWAVEGCLEWQSNGLEEPSEVIKATKSYQEEMDVLGRFLKEETVQEPQTQVQASVLSNRFKQWCEENGESLISSNAFGRKMTEFGFEKVRTEKGYFYKKIGLQKNMFS